MPDDPSTDRTQIQVAAPTVGALVGFPAIPGYEVLRELGRGGMGVVYAAKQLKLDRTVALKLMQSTDPQNKARFLAEGQVTAAVRHPNVVEVHDFGECDSGPYIAMEYLTGGTLADRLKAGHAFAPREAAELIAKVAAGVGAAHELGIVHRDLKPGNVLLAADGTPRVADFGLAKRTASDLTRTQDAAGTPAYMAPEQAKAMKFVGPPADVWSLGVMLYECLTGRKPFVADTDLELLIRIQNENPPTLRTVSRSVPHDLETVCLKCLEKEPDRRYAGAKELAADLEAWAEGKSIAARRATPVEKAMLWVRRKPTVAVAWALSLLVLLLGAFAATTTSLWQEAISEKEVAEDQRQKADEARKRAETAEGIAKQANADIADERERLAYARHVYLAHVEYQNNDCTRANMFLDLCPEKLRGWEWQYVHRLCHSYSRKSRCGSVVTCVAFSPDGTKIASGDNSHTACLYDTISGNKKHDFRDFTDDVYCVAFDDDGLRFVTGNGDGAARIWDVQTGKKLMALRGHSGLIYAVAFSPDGLRVATTCFDKTVRIWNVKSGTELSIIQDNAYHVLSVRFSADGSKIVLGCSDCTARIWDVVNGKEIVVLKDHSGTVTCGAFSPDGLKVLTGSYDAQVKIWDAITGKVIHTLSGHTGAVRSVAFSHDSTQLVSGSHDQTIRIWDAKTGATSVVLKGHTDIVLSAAFSADDKQILSGSADGTWRVWDKNKNNEKTTLVQHEASLNSFAFSPNGKRVVSCGWQGAKVWDAETGKELFTIQSHVNGGHSARYSTDGSRIVTAGWDRTPRVWDSTTGDQLLVLNGHIKEVLSIAFSPDGSHIVTGSNDETGRVWDAKTGKEVQQLKGTRGQVRSVTFSPDGTRIAACHGWGNTVGVWEAVTGKELFALDGQIHCVTYSSDGSHLFTGGSDGVGKIWDAKTGRELRSFMGHKKSIWSAAFNPDGTRVVTGGVDNTVRVWDVKTGAELLTLKGNTFNVSSVDFSPDGMRIISAGGFTGNIWDATPINHEFLPKAGERGALAP